MQPIYNEELLYVCDEDALVGKMFLIISDGPLYLSTVWASWV